MASKDPNEFPDPTAATKTTMMTLQTFAEYRCEAEDILTDIVKPELAADGAENVTIFLASEVSATISDTTGGLACQAFGIMPEFQDVLVDRQRSDNGPMVVFNDHVWERGNRHASRLALNSVVSHELCHHICYPSLAPYQPKRLDAASIIRAGYSSTLTEPVDSRVCKWEGHGLGWLLALAHVVARMRARGKAVDWSLACDFEFYGYSPAERYLEEFGTLAADSIDLPIRLALAQQPPAGLLALWLSDTRLAASQAV